MSRAAILRLAGEEFLADPSGALFHAGERLMIVADLHLEKGSSFARRGMLLPPYDTAATLAALAAAIARLRPKRVAALGDSFHDGAAHERVRAADRAALAALQAGRDWIWIAGNHDPAPPAGLAGDAVRELSFGAIALRHEPTPGRVEGEIAGHLHPVARVAAGGGATRARCFVSDGLRCVAPAFGALAGGLDLAHPAFAPLFGPRPVVAHVIGRDRVWRIPGARCGL
ncbi:MAG: ligase-associated DNA damage response endonuclease PdeM [Methylobacteriaceae bacterium]|nr:ligase-associated DNA damage response endonuclease PdeM [Methylobacteriaceae bacterium]